MRHAARSACKVERRWGCRRALPQLIPLPSSRAVKWKAFTHTQLGEAPRTGVQPYRPVNAALRYSTHDTESKLTLSRSDTDPKGQDLHLCAIPCTTPVTAHRIASTSRRGGRGPQALGAAQLLAAVAAWLRLRCSQRCQALEACLPGMLQAPRATRQSQPPSWQG